MGAIPLRQEPTTSFDSLWTAQGGGLGGGRGGGAERERETEELLSALNYLQRHFLLNVRKKTTGK